MKREKEFKKIKYALGKSRKKRRRKYKKLGALYRSVMALSSYFLMNTETNKEETVEGIKLGEDDGKNREKGENRSTIKLSEIPCVEKSSKTYTDEQGYMYGKNSARNGTLYLCCKNATAKDCNCRCIVRSNNLKDAKLFGDHNHRPDQKSIDRMKFAKTLEKVCLENPFMKPLLCYVKAKDLLGDQVDVENLLLPHQCAVFIHRKQGLHVPIKPKTIHQFEELIGNTKNNKIYAKDKSGKIFFRGVWRGTTGDNVAFVSERILQKAMKSKKVTLLMDGTFKAIPKHLQFRQLYIINIVKRKRCYPLAYVLMERKDFLSYKVVFNELKKMIPSLNVVKCMTDYELASRKAVREVFPNAVLSGCFFHYVQAIQKAAKRFGLRNKTDGYKFTAFINKVSALALLPNEFIAKGFESISKSVKSSTRWNRFASYWLRQWAKANISVYGLRHRTNNFSETLNRTINLLIGRKNPNIWYLIENLQTIESLKSDELDHVSKGLLIGRKKKVTKKMNKRIKRANKKFSKSQNVRKFLEYVTYDDDLADVYVHDLKEADIIDDFEEEVIPNSPNRKCNFRRTSTRQK